MDARVMLGSSELVGRSGGARPVQRSCQRGFTTKPRVGAGADGACTQADSARAVDCPEADTPHAGVPRAFRGFAFGTLAALRSAAPRVAPMNEREVMKSILTTATFLAVLAD